MKITTEEFEALAGGVAGAIVNEVMEVKLRQGKVIFYTKEKERIENELRKIDGEISPNNEECLRLSKGDDNLYRLLKLVSQYRVIPLCKLTNSSKSNFSFDDLFKDVSIDCLNEESTNRSYKLIEWSRSHKHFVYFAVEDNVVTSWGRATIGLEYNFKTIGEKRFLQPDKIAKTLQRTDTFIEMEETYV